MDQLLAVIKEFGALGLAVLIVWHNHTKFIPDIMRSFEDALKQQRSDFRESLKEQRNDFISHGVDRRHNDG